MSDELWLHRAYDGAPPTHLYSDVLWTAKTRLRRPQASGFHFHPFTVVLAQRDFPREGTSQIWFHDLGNRRRWPGAICHGLAHPRRWPSAYRVDGPSLSALPLSWSRKPRTYEEKLIWENRCREWLDYWRAKYADYKLPLAQRGRWDIRGRLRDWLEPRCAMSAVLASEMEIKHAGAFDWTMWHYSYLRERFVRVADDGQFHHAFTNREQPMLFARIFPPMQRQFGLESLYQRCWYIRHDDDLKTQDGVDDTDDRSDTVNHMTLSAGLPSEPWSGELDLIDPITRIHGPRERKKQWLKDHVPPEPVRVYDATTIAAKD